LKLFAAVANAQKVSAQRTGSLDAVLVRPAAAVGPNTKITTRRSSLVISGMAPFDIPVVAEAMRPNLLRLSRPLLPGKSINVQLAWEARPSTLPRRQGRRGRHYDFAQWFPKVAVYDRQGWHPNAFVRQGELYGEFGTFDVTFVLPHDQVIAASGVPVSGDPGWAPVSLPGSVAPRIESGAPTVRVPATHRAVRFVAQRVHHFGFSVSPDYRYEGSHWVRTHSDGRAPDTVSLHVLHERWEPGRTMAHLRRAMLWLEG
jgi:hypothetical protein